MAAAMGVAARRLCSAAAAPPRLKKLALHAPKSVSCSPFPPLPAAASSSSDPLRFTRLLSYSSMLSVSYNILFGMVYNSRLLVLSTEMSAQEENVFG
jgi:hypothetical protein